MQKWLTQMHRNTAICVTRIPCIQFSEKSLLKNPFCFTRMQHYGSTESRSTATPSSNEKINELNDLRIERITIKSNAGEIIEFNAVIQDTIPDGSSIGTMIACHGAPGSHNDFKHFLPYLKDRAIRFIGVNFPGFGFTPSDPRLFYDNRERLEFVKGIVEHLKLNEKLIFVGHSRGSETALKLGALFKERTAAIVLVNPMGLIVHRGIRPLWRLTLFVWLWNLGSVMQFILKPLIYLTYKYVLKIRAETGEIAATCVRAVESVDLPSQSDYIHILNCSAVRMLIVYAGHDWFIEPEISQHFASSFNDTKHMTCRSGAEDENITSAQVKKLTDEGVQRFAIYFPDDGHFLQKYRAKFIMDVVYWMLKDEQKRQLRRKAHL